MVGAFQAAVERARREPSLLFAALLPEESITAAFGCVRARWLNRVYSPAATV